MHADTDTMQCHRRHFMARYVKKEEPKREEPNITTEDPGPPVPQTMETVLTDGFDIPVLEDYWAGGASEELYAQAPQPTPF